MPKTGKRETQSREEIEQTLKEKSDTKVYRNTKNDGVARTKNIQELLANTILDFKDNTEKEKISLDDTDAVRSHVFFYLQTCQNVGQLPDMSGLALSLGYASRTLERWRSNKSEHPTSVFLEMCSDFFSSLISSAANNGDINTIYAIFTQKAKYAWRETTEILITPNNPLGSIKSDSELAKIAEKYSKDAIDVDV